MDNENEKKLSESSCRTCLSIDIDHKMITNTSIPCEDTEILYSDMLEVCTSVQIYPNDGFSNFICHNCEQHLLIAYNFRQTALKSQETLRNTPLKESSRLSEVKYEEENEILAGCDNENQEFGPCFDDDSGNSDDIKLSDLVPNKTGNRDNNITVVAKETTKIKCKRKPKVEVRKTRRGHPGITQIIDRHLVQLALDELKMKTVTGLDCSKCDFTSNGPRGLTSHVIQIHPELEGKWCRSCYQFFENLAEHEKTHFKERTFQCKFCDKSFFRVNSLIEHLKLHLGRTQICNICNKTFSCVRNLNRHKKLHSDKINNADLVLDNSLNKSESNANLKVAIKVPGKTVCEICEKTFRDQNKLEEHMRKHTGELPYLCPYCGKGFYRQFAVVTHMRIHTGEKPYICTECGKAFTQSTILTRHMTIHTGERPYQCKICSKRFLQRSGLRRHMFRHTGEKNSQNQNTERNEVCMVCSQRLRKAGDLRVHMRKHTGEKPFLCPECGRAFAQKRILAKHLKIHLDERPFVCTHCNKAFRHRTNLQDHIMIHTGEKPFQCKLCSYACIKRYNLTQHMRKHTEDSNTIDKSTEAV